MDLRSTFLQTAIESELEDAVGRENVSTAISDRLVYGYDCYWLSNMWAANGKTPPTADYIVSPGSTKEVAKVLRIANYYKIPVTTIGGTAGGQGGSLPVCGGIGLNMKRLNKIVDFDEESMCVTVETGMIFQQLEWYANERGYSLMHFPSSVTCSTVGGFMAHNGIGVLSTKYGKLDDQCLNLEIVTPSGAVLHTAPVPKHASGPDLKGVFLGSEGTLGVMTKATFKLFKIPEVRLFRGFLFKDLSSGLKAGRDMLKEFKPSIIRLYDEAETVSIIKNIIGVAKPGAFMNIAVDGKKEVAGFELERAMEICLGYGAEDMGPEYGEKWWNSRVTFFYPGKFFGYPQMYGTMDTVAVYSKIEHIYREMKYAIENTYRDVRFIAHFSHWYEWGCMVYDRFIMDSPPTDPIEAFKLHNEIWMTGVRTALKNGGVINDHHGVGMKLGKLMKEQYGPSMQVFEGIKKTLDPNGIMNPLKLGL
jgi:alkyldihydroxyacetonephosphate synthase